MQQVTRHALQTKILAFGCALVPVLILIRGYTMGITLDAISNPLRLAGQLLSGAKHDLILVAAFIGSLLILAQFARTARMQRFVGRTAVALAVFAVAMSAINITIVDYLGGPLSYAWFYYADFGLATTVHTALYEVISLKVTLTILMAVLTMLGLSHYLGSAIAYARSVTRLHHLALIFMAVFGIGAALAAPHWKAYPTYRGEVANPVLHFARSLSADDSSPLLSLATPNNPEDFLIFADRAPEPQPYAPRTNTGIRNVLLYVMESVPAAYVDTYGGPYDVTPTLVQYKNASVQFQNIYAHAPGTHKSLISILTAVYPLISYKEITREMPDADLPSISKLLKRKGYRTGYFSSADLRYAAADRFLAGHAFDAIRDQGSIDCATQFQGSTDGIEKYLDASVDDLCTANAAIEWITASTNSPFFAMVWTNGTHYPYFVSGSQKSYTSEDKEKNRYLNALRRVDQALGQLLEALDEANLSESTLVVVTGDHGEAFGQHGQRGHGGNVYEENIHVPLILINPLIGNGTVRATIGGHIDIAPTVTELLGLADNALWQGRSLFSQDRSQTTYFFSGWGDLQFGYRHANQKQFFNATADRCESYDLAADPHELQNHVPVSDSECLSIKQRVAAWMQYQHRLTTRIMRTASRAK